MATPYEHDPARGLTPEPQPRPQPAPPPAPEPERVYTPEPFEPEPLVDAAEAQEIDAGEPVASPDPGLYLTAALCGKPLRVLPQKAWRLSWNRMARAGDIDGLLDHIVYPDDLELVDELDPTLEEFEVFMGDVGELSGEPAGKPHGPSRSSRRMRRR